MLWSELFFWQLFKPFSRLDFQQPCFSYTLKWEKKKNSNKQRLIRSNPNSLKQLKAYVTPTHSIPMIYLITHSPCHKCSTWGRSLFSWLTLLLIVIIQLGPLCTSSTHFPTYQIPTIPKGLAVVGMTSPILGCECSNSRCPGPYLSNSTLTLFAWWAPR